MCIRDSYIVMEYLDGITLRQMVERDGPIPIQTLLPPMLSFIRDLSTMHQRGVLHRDIAPDLSLIHISPIAAAGVSSHP